jgi:CheY-like chemotaxis protein
MHSRLSTWLGRRTSRRVQAPGQRELVDIVIIDDDVAAGSLLSRVLKMQGFATVAAHDGPSGIALILQSFPSLVILDVMMPDMDGWQVLQRLKNDKSTWAIPVVMYSAICDTIYREKAANLGASDYWVKASLNSGQMKQSIDRLLKANVGTVGLSAAG